MSDNKRDPRLQETPGTVELQQMTALQLVGLAVGFLVAVGLLWGLLTLLVGPL